MKKYFKIIRKFKLQHYLKCVLENSTSNGLPYHNLYHVMCMVRNVYFIGKDEGLDKKSIKNLIIAALFHDFDHSGGKISDTENVKNAIKIFEEYSIQPKEDNLKIIEIIKATEYPYVIDENKLNLSQKIIRDADLLQAFTDNHVQQLIIGLGTQELSKTIKEILPLQKQFITDAIFHTKYAQDIYFENIEGLLQDLDFLKSVLNCR